MAVIGTAKDSLIWLVAGAVLVLCCTSCSVLGERLPPSDPAQRTTRMAAHCSDANYPLADTLSTVAGVGWVVYANGKIEENEPKPGRYIINQFGGRDFVPESSGSPSDVSTFKWLRAGGYAAIGLYGLSAIYGWVVETKCHSLREELKPKLTKKPDTPTRPSFPSGVLDFDFEQQPAEAERRCVAQGRSWSFEANVGLCRSPRRSAANPDVRLEFELGVPSQITVIYRTPPEQLATAYQQLDSSMHKIYGPAQVAPAPLSPSCSASLTECLQNDEHPGGPAWNWAGGSIEIRPVWQEDGASLELRYLRSEPDAR